MKNFEIGFIAYRDRQTKKFKKTKALIAAETPDIISAQKCMFDKFCKKK
ncbi:MAG: hypothetical protein NC548_51575 [Lachnospiraceae bacterium]|nr:hypothetical protein [Lachnospiraceae bacterium]